MSTEAPPNGSSTGQFSFAATVVGSILAAVAATSLIAGFSGVLQIPSLASDVLNLKTENLARIQDLRAVQQDMQKTASALADRLHAVELENDIAIKRLDSGALRDTEINTALQHLEVQFAASQAAQNEDIKLLQRQVEAPIATHAGVSRR